MLSEGEIKLRHFLDSYLKDIPYYEFSAGGPVHNRPLSSIDYHGLKTAWGCCALLLCTSRNIFDLFGAKRIATHYSDEQDRWLFVHQPASVVVFRSQVAKTGENGEVEMRRQTVPVESFEVEIERRTTALENAREGPSRNGGGLDLGGA